MTKLTRHLLRTLPAALPLLMISHVAQAVMPPYYEARAALGRLEAADEQRRHASDAVVLRVKQVRLAEPDERGCPSYLPWTLDAEVVKVLRGRLKPGMVIQLQHTWERYMCPGPVREPLPILTVGQETEAFLHCTDAAVCTLAAGPMSFVGTEAFTKEWDRRKDDVQHFNRP
ncbi:MAG TPA: hypothetical protein VFW93_12605 [Aquabacterium sp.]|uniref:hypothetical protein n=1 Tax=Aquabacterium sp. TaxID=1872578 RepID=UPI002E2FC231|nr:hypothetical protein [Aquabacterium sp.]HEX5357056.1 hypothetical protein [Aquabacterium sp.]